MQTQEPITAEPKPKPPRRNLILAVAAIAIAVIVGLVVFLPGDEEPLADDPVSPPVTTVAATTPEAVEEPEVATTLSADEITQGTNAALLDAMFAARNSGDFDAWTSFLADDAEVWGSSPGSVEWVEWQRSVIAANEQWTVVGQCLWPNPNLADCETTLVNDFHGPAGIVSRVRNLVIAFNDSGAVSSIGANSWEIAGDPAEYNTAFDTWFAQTYPDVYATLGPTVDGEDGLPNAGAMPTALPYVDEFLAQSEVYSLDG